MLVALQELDRLRHVLEVGDARLDVVLNEAAESDTADNLWSAVTEGLCPLSSHSDILGILPASCCCAT